MKKIEVILIIKSITNPEDKSVIKFDSNENKVFCEIYSKARQLAYTKNIMQEIEFCEIIEDLIIENKEYSTFIKFNNLYNFELSTSWI